MTWWEWILVHWNGGNHIHGIKDRPLSTYHRFKKTHNDQIHDESCNKKKKNITKFSLQDPVYIRKQKTKYIKVMNLVMMESK